MASPEIAILVSSFERPRHLRRVLASIAAQRGVDGAFEVVVTDDGSRDETPRVVRRFAESVSFPVRFVTHSHDGFQVARCRNEGVQASTAPYLLFLDGDCLIPPDHVRIHLNRRRAGYVLAGYPIYLNESFTEQITEQNAADGSYSKYVSSLQHLQMQWRHWRSAFYSLMRDRKRPKLLGGNLGIARTDYESVNGYDENFRGWGCEDDDLRARLQARGIGVASIAAWTCTYHLWHPKTPSAPSTWRTGANVDYFRRPLRLMRCIAGLTKRRLQDLHIEVVGRRPSADVLNQLLPLWCRVAISTSGSREGLPDLEFAFAGGSSNFSQRQECRVLVVPRGQLPTNALLAGADVVFTDCDSPICGETPIFRVSDFDSVMQHQLGARKQSRHVRVA